MHENVILLIKLILNILVLRQMVHRSVSEYNLKNIKLPFKDTILTSHAYKRVEVYAINMRFYLPRIIKPYLNLLFHLIEKF